MPPTRWKLPVTKTCTCSCTERAFSIIWTVSSMVAVLVTLPASDEPSQIWAYRLSSVSVPKFMSDRFKLASIGTAGMADEIAHDE